VTKIGMDDAMGPDIFPATIT